MKHAEPPTPPSCSLVLARLREAVVLASAGAVPADASAHVEACPRCRAELEGMVWLDSTLSSALRSARTGIPGPSREDIDSILSATRMEPAEAALFRNVRRSVRRMLLLTLLVLSFLAICLVAWALIIHLKTHGG